ncbi:hypothetical protein T484DRAFT_1754962 [Baffinella frigidus]|nr:hypothetical protein T484DRAFT_1754962 [Cryptophyta sp. CCMP2293]
MPRVAPLVERLLLVTQCAVYALVLYSLLTTVLRPHDEHHLNTSDRIAAILNTSETIAAVLDRHDRQRSSVQQDRHDRQTVLQLRDRYYTLYRFEEQAGGSVDYK